MGDLDLRRFRSLGRLVFRNRKLINNIFVTRTIRFGNTLNKNIFMLSIVTIFNLRRLLTFDVKCLLMCELCEELN